jgi:prepilin-type processing-associated H-X9-DG protein
VDKYEGGFRSLTYASADANQVAESLILNYGFHRTNVKRLINSDATLGRIRSELSKLTNPRTVGADDRVVIFFAGHGQTIPLPGGGDMGFLVPFGANIPAEDMMNPEPFNDQALSMEDLWRYLRSVAARHVLVMADACFSGLMAQLRGSDAPNQRSIDEDLKRRARVIITAGAKDQASVENSSLGHGLFTAKLLDELGIRADVGPGRVFRSQTLFAELRTAVSNASGGSQVPQFKVDGEGDVLFRPEMTVPQSAAEKTEPAVPTPVEAKVLRDITFDNAKVEDVVREIARQGGFEFKIGAGVAGSVSLSYTRISVRNALNAVLDQVNANWKFVGGEVQIELNSPALPPKDSNRDALVASIELDGADVRDGLRILFKVQGYSYQISQDVQGTLTCSYKNVPFETVLQGLLRQVDATYRVEGGVYSIVRKLEVPVTETRPISLDEKNADGRAVLAKIFDAMKVSFTIDPAIVGKVSLKLNEVPLETALAEVLKQLGAEHTVTEGGIYRVRSKTSQPTFLNPIDCAKKLAMGFVILLTDYDDIIPWVQDSGTMRNMLVLYLKDKETLKTHNPAGGQIAYNPALWGVALKDIAEQARTVVFFDSLPWPDGKRIVGFADGHVKFVSSAEWKNLEPQLKAKFKRTAKKPLPVAKDPLKGS